MFTLMIIYTHASIIVIKMPINDANWTRLYLADWWAKSFCAKFNNNSDKIITNCIYKSIRRACEFGYEWSLAIKSHVNRFYPKSKQWTRHVFRNCFYIDKHLRWMMFEDFSTRKQEGFPLPYSQNGRYFITYFV